MNISNIILEEIIRGYIVEQRQKKAIVSKLSRSQQRLMKSAGGINGFDLKITYAGIKPTTFSTTDLARLIDATGTTNVGRNSNFDKRDPKNGNEPAFVYVVSKDVSSNRQTAKFNVWIMHYAPLAVLSNKIIDAQHSTNSGEDTIYLEGEIFGDIGSIRVVNDSDFTKYINTLKTLSTKYSLQLTDNNKQIAWPNVTAINTQSADDAESDATTDATTQSKEFNIKNGNFEELATFLNKPISDIKEQLAHLDVIKFSGTVKYIPNTEKVILQNAFTIVASQGSCQVEVDGVPGFFEGSFKDNLPAIGTYTPIFNGQPGTPVTGKWDAEEGYTASGDAVKLKLTPTATTTTIQVSSNAENLSVDGKSTGRYTTLYSPKNWKNVYTYVNGKWYYASKEQFNSNSVSSVGEVTEQKVLDYLSTDKSSVDLKTAQSDWKIDDPVKLFKNTGLTFPVPKNTSNTVSKDKTKDKSKSKIISTAFKPGSTYKSIGKLIPLYKFINKETGFKQFSRYEPDPNEAFKIQSLSSDKKYAYGRFIADPDNDTYWIKVSNLKK